MRDRFFLGCCWAGGWVCGATVATGGAWAAGTTAGGVVGVKGEVGAAGVGVAGLRPLLYIGALCLNCAGRAGLGALGSSGGRPASREDGAVSRTRPEGPAGLAPPQGVPGPASPRGMERPCRISLALMAFGSRLLGPWQLAQRASSSTSRGSGGRAPEGPSLEPEVLGLCRQDTRALVSSWPGASPPDPRHWREGGRAASSPTRLPDPVAAPGGPSPGAGSGQQRRAPPSRTLRVCSSLQHLFSEILGL